MRAVRVATEGSSDASVLRAVLAATGIETVGVYGLRGKDYLDARLRAFNSAARFGPWVVLRDLDQDAPCAGLLVARLLPERAPCMRLRVAVRATEAWLLADPEAFAGYFGVPRARVPPAPERLPDPKAVVLDLARRSRRREIREDMVPEVGTSAKVGPAYTFHVMRFAEGTWRPLVAAKRSSSLARAMRAFRDWPAA